MIDIPDVSSDYIVAIGNYLLSLSSEGRRDLYKLVDQVASMTISVDACIAFGDSKIGGCKTFDELIESKKAQEGDKALFEMSTITEYSKFKIREYTSGDFIHIFINAYLISMIGLQMEG
jgi:hypothetical protein